jgi:hypothetical protein
MLSTPLSYAATAHCAAAEHPARSAFNLGLAPVLGSLVPERDPTTDKLPETHAWIVRNGLKFTTSNEEQVSNHLTLAEALQDLVLGLLTQKAMEIKIAVFQMRQVFK